MNSKKILVWAIVEMLFAPLAVPTGVTAQDKTAQARQRSTITTGSSTWERFGGPTSGVSWGVPRELLLSKRGPVVGFADTPYPEPYRPHATIAKRAYLGDDRSAGFTGGARLFSF